MTDIIRLTIHETGHQPGETDWQRGSTRWACTLHYQDRTMECAYFTGSGITTTPTMAEVTACLAMDADTYDNVGDEWEWYAEYGIKPSRAEHETWLRVGEQAAALRVLLGADYADLMACLLDLDGSEVADLADQRGDA